jgi:hypothetical protein
MLEEAEENHENIRIAGLLYEIRKRKFFKTNQECYPVQKLL